MWKDKKKILAIRSTMNKGLTSALKDVFPSITPAPKPIVDVDGIPDPE
jgi:hypothetical protein